MPTRLFDFEPVFAQLAQDGFADWAEALQAACATAIKPAAHGLLDEWKSHWQNLPTIPDAVLGASQDFALRGEVTADQSAALKELLLQFKPWRKGPFNIFDIHIDTEWRSDWKWDRLRSHVELRDRDVLDIGCGNGYYGWRMLAAGARSVMGLDPFLLYVMQHEAIRKLVGGSHANYVLPVGDDCVPDSLQAFDVTFSMGVLYHRPSPISHLQKLFGSLKAGGQVVLETLVVDGNKTTVLVPEGRYAKMRNVWFIPSVEMLELWMQRVGFRDVAVVDVTTTSLDEQRSTNWMTFESLPDFLSPDRSKTAEGHPPPIRAVLVARRPS